MSSICHVSAKFVLKLYSLNCQDNPVYCTTHKSPAAYGDVMLPETYHTKYGR